MSPLSDLFGLRHNRKKRPKRTTPPRSTRLRFEPLETRLMLADLTTLHFNIPPETADLGVEVGLYSNTSSVYLDPGSQTFKKLDGFSGDVPLFSLAEPAGGDVAPYAEPVVYDLHIPSQQDVESGELFIFVGDDHPKLTASGGTVAAPKAVPDPSSSDAPYNFAQFEFNYQAEGAGAGLDIDISAVDSTGYPFTLVYPSSTNLPFPLNPLGITLDQEDLNVNFRRAFEPGGQYSEYPEFAQCAAFSDARAPEGLQQVVAPQDILSVETTPPILHSATPTMDEDSRLAADASYSYCITAFSDNVIANSNGVHGETLLSNTITVQDLSDGTSVELTWDRYYDPNTAGYNIYRYSTTNGAAPTDSTAYNLIAQIEGAVTTSYVDQGAIPQAQQISVDGQNNYGFNPLSEYYTQEILDFFTQYSAPNSFTMRSNGALWVGNTVSYTPGASWNADGASYTVLQLSAQNAVAGTTIEQGDVVNIYQPIFSSNTRYVLADAPPMPDWMAKAADPHESPAQMVFGCDVAFASDKHDPDVVSNGDLATALAAIENSIVSALNRGIATDDAIPPDNWASFPQMLDYPTVTTDARSEVTAATKYFYAVTAVNVYGETTPSLTVAAELRAGEIATLNWTSGENAAPATAYKIYRGTSPDELTLLDITASGQSASYIDVGKPATGPSLPNQYFAPGTKSNWYAAIVQTNSLLDPRTGVSINGLSYGFPYSDQGGTSTNILFPPGDIPATITVNLGAPHSPGFVTQSLPDAVTNSSYRHTLLTSGSGTGTRFTISDGQLPGWMSLDANTGVLSGVVPGVATSTSYDFTVRVSDSVGSTSLPFSLRVVDVEPAAPLTVVGLKGTTLNLPAADQNLPYSAQIHVTGGVGPYTLALKPGVQLPAGLQLGTLGSQPMTSQDGVFVLSGTQTSEYDSPSVGFDVVVSDASSSFGFTMTLTVNKALAIETPALPDAAKNQPYSQTISTNLKDDGVRFSVTSGALPKGLTLEPWGVLRGTTTEIGSFVFEVKAVDTAGGTAVAHYSMEVKDKPAASLAIATTKLPPAAPGKPYNQTISTTGGSPGDVAFAIVNGELPSGLALSEDGKINGTPSDGGVAAFTVRARDSFGNTAFESYELGVLTVTASATKLGASATSLVIQGAGFDPTRANNTVDLPGSGASDIQVTAATPTSLEISFTGPLMAGPLQATVTVDGTTSNPQQVADVVVASTPTITPSTSRLAANATTLAITGSGFDLSSPGANIVSLSSGTVKSVTIDSDTQLTVMLNGEPLTVGLLTATVTTNGVSSTARQVADVVAASTPTIDANGCIIFQNQTGLVIGGTGFDSSPTGVTIVDLKVAGQGVAFDSVTVNSANQLTVTGLNFSADDVAKGLTAQVTVNGVASREAQVATIQADSQPVLALSGPTPNLAPNATRLTLYGWGFTSNSTVTLSENIGKGWETISGFSTSVDSPNQITVTGLKLQTPTSGVGTVAAVINDPTNGSSGGMAAVGTVPLKEREAPTVTASTSPVSCNSGTLTINGTGFDPNGMNVVTLYSSGEELPVMAIASTVSGSGQDIKVSSDGTQLTVNLAGPLPVGSLQAYVTTDGVRSSGLVQVASVVGPTINQAATKISRSPTFVTIDGLGFDVKGVNDVTLYTGAEQIPLAADVVESVVANSSTELSVVLNASSPLPAGELWATARVNGISAGAATQVAQVVDLGPTLHFDGAALPSDAKSLVITGDHFGTTAGSNTVTISSVTGPISKAVAHVSAESPSTLNVTLNPGLFSTGQLYATVETAGVVSDVVQIGNVIPAPAAAATSTIHVSRSLQYAGGSVQVRLHAKDSLGRDVTTGGLDVAFALAPGSAGGVFGPVVDNGDGTYLTTFTSSRIGRNTFTATLNGLTTTSTATLLADSDFFWYAYTAHNTVTAGPLLRPPLTQHDLIGQGLLQHTSQGSGPMLYDVSFGATTSALWRRRFDSGLNGCDTIRRSVSRDKMSIERDSPAIRNFEEEQLPSREFLPESPARQSSDLVPESTDVEGAEKTFEEDESNLKGDSQDKGDDAQEAASSE